MRTIDGLLSLLASQRADGLQIQRDRPPLLLRGEETIPLSMPPLDAGTFGIIEAELIPEAARATWQHETPLSLGYETSRGDAFTVTARVEHGQPVLRVFAGDGATPATLGHVVASSYSSASSRPPVAQHRRPGLATRDQSTGHRIDMPVETNQPANGESFSSPPSSYEIRLDLDDPDDAGPLTDLVAMLADDAVTDLLISSSASPRVRRGGVLRALDDHLPSVAWIDHLCHRLDASHRRTLVEHGSCDAALMISGHDVHYRFRANVFRQRGGLSVALRPIRERIRSLGELSLPSSLETLADLRSGLVLLTGTAGSGKSTTMVALVEYLNRTHARHIITIEDPIEYVYTSRQSLIHQREIGRDVSSFAMGLRAALRESPDVILVGEMRDDATIAAALTAAETGHLVISTLHCATAPTAIDRITDSFSADKQGAVRHQLANVLRSVVTQRLIPGRGGKLYPAVEIMRVNTAVASKIRDNKVYSLPSEIQTGRADGMEPLELSLAKLVAQGCISIGDARRHTDNPKLIDDYARGLGRP